MERFIKISPRKYKTPFDKKLAKIERKFEETPEKCVLTRERLMCMAENLMNPVRKRMKKKRR